MNELLKQRLEGVKKTVLIYDIETCSTYPGTDTKINIQTNFEDYVKFAKCKFFGCFSYKYNKYVCDEVYGNEEKIKAFIDEHEIVCGFNNVEFDTPIIFNNDLVPENKYLKEIDCLQILGSSAFQNHKGLPFKNRGSYMGYKFKKNSLKYMAEAMELEVQKGDIDYNIFFQDTYTEQERSDIIKYLESDVKVTKLMFDKLWDFWLPFTEFLDTKNVLNLSWIKASIASLTYKDACNTLGVEETYGQKSEEEKEEMGGRVIDPKYEEARNVWYVDFTSLYPHIFAMFNLFSEEGYSDDEVFQMAIGDGIWHGNDVFKVKGYYTVHEHHKLSNAVMKRLKQRMAIKAETKKTGVKNPLEYAIKILLNSLYGAVRSPIFEQVHSENAGWDCCWLGQQMQELLENMMKEFGFETIAGDTDSIFVVLNNKSIFNHVNKASQTTEQEYVKNCLAKVVQKIKDNVPFPCDTFDIDIEYGRQIPYVMWPFSDQAIVDPLTGKNIKKGNRLVKERKGKKKNYCYIVFDDKEQKEVLKLVGLPIKKDNATLLGPMIFKEVLEPLILANKRAKFERGFIDELLNEYLQREGALDLLAREYKVKPLKSYKNPSQIQAQISAGYFEGQGGVIRLIKNKVCGNAGKTAKYATAEQIKEAGLTTKDLDLEKVNNELEPFVEYEEVQKQ